MGVVRLLVTQGASVSLADEVGASPLYAACANGHVDVAQQLLECHADVDQAAHDGFTPLIAACDHGREAAVRLLLDHGDTVRARVNTALAS